MILLAAAFVGLPLLDGCGGDLAATDAEAADAGPTGQTSDGGIPSGADCSPGRAKCGSACVDTLNDPEHCGDCANVCVAQANVADDECVNGACIVGACAAGFVDCDNNSAYGCETRLSSPSSCGGCGIVCPSTTTVCDETSGVYACVAPPAPRQLAPLSTSFVTSRRPTLTWTLPAGVGDATVDLCSDRACAVPIESSHVTGTTFTPDADLPTGVVYWRVHPFQLTEVVSATWQFSVGTRTAPVSTSWGTALDINGDGYTDFAMSGNPSYNFKIGRVYVYLGSASGISASPVLTINDPDAGDAYAFDIASAGDVNGDGFADMIVSASFGSSTAGNAYVYLGSATGLSSTAATTLVGPDGSGGYFATSVSSAGDVNGDGYADVIVGAHTAANGVGQAYLYTGSATGLQTTPAVTLSVVPTDGNSGLFGSAVASAGDLNGDGYADVIVGAEAAYMTGTAYVFMGGATGLSTTPVPLSGPEGGSYQGHFGHSLANAGDLNGDGYSDIVVGAYYAPGTSSDAAGVGRAYVFLGSAAGVDTVPIELDSPDGDHSGQFGISVTGIGDANHDGYSDLFIGASSANTGGNVYVFFGGPSGIPTVPSLTLGGVGQFADEFGLSVSTGDFNGDAYSDLVVGEPGPGQSGFLGDASFFMGGVAGLTASPTTSRTPSDGYSGFGNIVTSGQ